MTSSETPRIDSSIEKGRSGSQVSTAWWAVSRMVGPRLRKRFP